MSSTAVLSRLIRRGAQFNPKAASFALRLGNAFINKPAEQGTKKPPAGGFFYRSECAESEVEAQAETAAERAFATIQ